MKAYTLAIFLMVAVLFVLTNYAESKMLMGKGGGWRSRSRGRRPWDRNRSAERIWNRRPTGDRYRQLEEMEQDGVPRRRQNYGRNYQDEDDKPCIGLCEYYRSKGLPNPYE